MVASFPPNSLELRLRDGDSAVTLKPPAGPLESSSACARIVHNLPGAAVLLFDRELRYCAAEGPELEQAAGFDASLLVGRRMQDVLPADERECAEPLYRATLEGRRVRMEMRRGNQWYQVHTVPVYDAAGVVTHGMVVAYDVTELKSVQAELAHKSSILASILDNMSEGVLVAGSSGEPILFNPAGQRLLGLSAEAEHGGADPVLYLADRVTPLDVERVPLTRALAGERVEQEELFAKGARTADDRWYSVNATPLVDAQGAQRGGVCVVRDVTSAKNAELLLREQTAFVELLQRITLSANTATSSRDALRECLSSICEHTRWPVGHVYTWDPGEQRLRPSDLWHLESEHYAPLCAATAQAPLARGEGLPGLVLQTHRAEWFEDVSIVADDPRKDLARSLGIHGSVAFPVLVAADVVCVLEFFSSERQRPHERLLAVMENVGVQLGRAVERERHIAAIEALSLTDELTRLHNRRGFMEHARRQIKILRRQRRHALLFFADLDGLKRINDELGHEIGDAAIVAAADVLRQSFRDTDVIARFGGDEFVVLVAETDAAVGARILERIEGNLRRWNESADSAFSLAMSIGVSAYDPDQPMPLEELLATADAAMYQQKQRRRRARPTLP